MAQLWGVKTFLRQYDEIYLRTLLQIQKATFQNQLHFLSI